MARYLDYDGLQEFKNNLDLKYEEKVEGKGLSTNDFTTALKNKLDNIEAGATANEGTVTGITIGQTDYIPIDGQITLPDYPTTFGASGTNHSTGLVPDPGATQGNTKYLREDGTWAEPASGGTSYTFAEGTTDGAFTVTPANGTAQTVPVHKAISYTETTTGITNLDATLITTALRKTAQTLTAAEKTQVKANIGIPNITISTSEPTSSDGNDGDIWLVYEA